MNKPSVRMIADVSILAAMVYVTSAFLQIPIPTPIGSTRLHLGNVMCLLSGMLLGPWYGGLAAGFGSMLFDLLNPAYIASAPFTFVFKFAMAAVCSLVIGARSDKKRWCLLGSFTGAITYVILYLGKSFAESYLVLGVPFETVWLTLVQKGTVSTINGIIAATVSVPLFFALRSALRKAELYPIN